jgi:hypothetical protein
MQIKPILTLITDRLGYATKDFLVTTPEQWAVEQMTKRYAKPYVEALVECDSMNPFPRLCFDHLCEERRALGKWFDSAGKLNLMLQSASLTNKLSGPIEDGIGWDWKANGDSEEHMVYFKTRLLTACLLTMQIPTKERHSGSKLFGGISSIICSAYTDRASIHRWNGIPARGDHPAMSGVIMSRRWVAHMSFTFLMTLTTDRKWAWDASKCKGVFGDVDEDRGAY